MDKTELLKICTKGRKEAEEGYRLASYKSPEECICLSLCCLYDIIRCVTELACDALRAYGEDNEVPCQQITPPKILMT